MRSSEPTHLFDDRYRAWNEEYDEAFRAYRSHMCAASGAAGRDARAELEEAHAALRRIARLRTVLAAPTGRGRTGSAARAVGSRRAGLVPARRRPSVGPA